MMTGFRGWLTLLIVLGTVLSWQPAVTWAAPSPAALFEIHCAGCHPNGNNIVRRGKSLKLPALKKYGLDSTAAIADLITNGKGNMSAYRDRLSAPEIETLATYVLTQAEKGWKP